LNKANLNTRDKRLEEEEQRSNMRGERSGTEERFIQAENDPKLLHFDVDESH
jgi:hypothetical protein